MTRTEAYIALNMIPKLGPIGIRRLIKALGSPERVLSASMAELRQVKKIGPEIAGSIVSWRNSVDLKNELLEIQRHNVTVITLEDDAYPRSLREIHDAPILLYILGNLIPQDHYSIAVVGTRKPSHYAAECAKKLSYQLAYSGITVISGLARGVDTLAHQGALAAKGRTIAVIGSGLAKLYPPENHELARRIATSGAVISEFSMTTQADRQTFPMRNRIVSGCSLGLLVIEAGHRSGALITANQAIEQGRSIYTVPGRIDNLNAIGSNRLIQQGAKLILSAEDVLEDLQLLIPPCPKGLSSSAAEDTFYPPSPSNKSLVSHPITPLLTSELEYAVYKTLESEELTPDEIIAKSGLPSHQVSSTLLALEIRRVIKQLPGNRFVKLIGSFDVKSTHHR